MIAFGGLLLAIAILPLVAGRWFEKNRNRALVAGLFGLPVLAYLVLRFGGDGVDLVLHTGEEYVSFIVLLASLFTISGGIYLTGNLLGTPMSNLGFLFLDNADLHLNGAGLPLCRPDGRADGRSRPSARGPAARFLAAISCGAVFMGANSYIGNDPNFMIKSIAEESEVKMPSFFGYMAYSRLVLVPIFAVVTLVFFR
jgi:Na+/H+ antiporter NhaD/arsenite permease-like protein